MMARLVAAGTPVLAIAFAVLPLTPGDVTAETDFRVGARVGTVQPGPQNTLKGGAAEGGLLLELRTSERFEFGLGLSFARDPGGGHGRFPRPRVSVMTLDVHARRTFTDWRIRPYLDLGLGLYQIERKSTYTARPGTSTSTSLGTPVGAGASFALSRRLAMRIGAEYHPIFAAVAAGGGNLEDYFWIGAALLFRL